MKIENIKPGMVLYNVCRTKMGNTTRRTTSIYAVKIISVAEDLSSAVVSWNGNKPREWSKKNVEKLRKSQPRLITSLMGDQRVARKGE